MTEIKPNYRQKRMSIDTAITCTMTPTQEKAYYELYGIWINQRD